MVNFGNMMKQAQELQKKMAEAQEKLNSIEVEGISGGGAVKILMNGEGELKKITFNEAAYKEPKEILEDLIVAAHNSAKLQLKSKTSEEIAKATGDFGIPGFKWPF